MNLGERVRDMIRHWLQIQPAQNQRIFIQESIGFEADVARNLVWYRGDASELDQIFKQLQTDAVGQARFWAAAPETQQIRKIHSGLPGMMAESLASVVKADLGEVAFGGGENGKSEWDELTKELDFPKLVSSSVVNTLVTGDGAFKISTDSTVSPYPLVEFWSADRVRYQTKHGRIVGICFYSTHYSGKKEFQLCEDYCKGSVSYHLWDGGKEVPLDTVPELAGLKPVTFSGDYIMAVPLRFYDSAKYPGRGRSIFDGKTEVFDAHDEVISQWMDAVRAGRVQKYIPDDLMPRDANGQVYCPNSFGTNFIQLGHSVKEDAKAGQIQVVQPDISFEAYRSTYCSTLDMCLQGILSPATLGIDLGKMSSADAQRERKDVTGNTRNAITSALEKALPELVKTVLLSYDNMRERQSGCYEPSVTFGEYGAPDFDSRVETVCKAASAGIMSVHAQVEELWGGSKDEDWIDKEVQRIQQEKGIVVAEEPSTGGDLVDVE